MESKQADFGSKRSFLRLSAAAATLAGLRIVTEPMLAQAARRHFAVVSRKDGIFIDSNENPLGPSTAAREAVAGITPEGGRYRDDLSEELIKLFAEQQGLKTDSIRLFAGSTEPLHYTVLAYTSPKLSYVTADPGFEAGIYMSKISGARVVAVPLTKSYAHDVRAMVSAAPDAGPLGKDSAPAPSAHKARRSVPPGNRRRRGRRRWWPTARAAASAEFAPSLG